MTAPGKDEAVVTHFYDPRGFIPHAVTAGFGTLNATSDPARVVCAICQGALASGVVASSVVVPAAEPERAGFYRCSGCRHAPHERPCLNMASDNDCDCPGGLSVEFVSTSPAAEPGGLTEAEFIDMACEVIREHSGTDVLRSSLGRVWDRVEPLLAARAPAREAVNPILADALTYYAERRPMNNPKGWDHVLRKVEQGIAAGLWSATPAQIEEARSVLGALATAPARDGLAERVAALVEKADTVANHFGHVGYVFTADLRALLAETTATEGGEGRD